MLRLFQEQQIFQREYREYSETREFTSRFAQFALWNAKTDYSLSLFDHAHRLPNLTQMIGRMHKDG